MFCGQRIPKQGVSVTVHQDLCIEDLFYFLQRSRHLLSWISRRVDLAVALTVTSPRRQQLLTQNVYLKHHIRLDKRDLQLRGNNFQYLVLFRAVHLCTTLYVELKLRLVTLKTTTSGTSCDNATLYYGLITMITLRRRRRLTTRST